MCAYNQLVEILLDYLPLFTYSFDLHMFVPCITMLDLRTGILTYGPKHRRDCAMHCKRLAHCII